MSSKKKTYWKGFAEKHQTQEFAESSEKEFHSELPIDQFVGEEGLEKIETGRRDFLKFMGFSVAAATLASCEAPVIKSIPYLNKPEDITPGVASWYSSSFYDGTDFANILVKSREGRPIWLKGNKNDTYTKGGLTPRISASILNLYNSARLSGPILNTEETSWENVDKEISSKLTDIANAGGKIRILSNTIISPTTQLVIDDFIKSFNSKTELTSNTDTLDSSLSMAGAVGLNPNSADIKHVEYDSVSYFGMRKANEESFGKYVLPDYNFDKAKVIVSISADFTSNWIMPTKFSTDYSKTRIPENEWMSRHYQFESVLSLTGANSDYRGQIKPSQEGLVALGILNVISGKPAGVKVNDNIKTLINDSAAALKSAKGESIVVSGSNNKDIQVLVNAINQKLNNYGSTIDLDSPLEVYHANDGDVEELYNEEIDGKVDALIVYGVNPAYSMPNGSAFADAISKMKLSVSFSGYADETASKCQYTCPDHNYLESWNDLKPKSGHYALQQPLIRPLYNTRQAQESLLVWAGLGERSVQQESTTYHSYLKQSWEKYGFNQQNKHLLFSDYWNNAVHNGYSNGELEILKEASLASYYTDTSLKASAAVKKLAENTSNWEFTTYQKELGVGDYAANAWLQELPDSITKVVWDNYITMAPSDCYTTFGINTSNEKSAWDGVHLGQEEPAYVANIKVNDNTIKLPVYPLPGQTPGTIGVSLGYGRGENQENIGKAAFQCGEYGDYLLDESGNKIPVGANAFKLTSFNNNSLVYSGNVELNATDEKYALACTQTHHTIMGRTSIFRETSLDVFKDSPKKDYNPRHVLHKHSEGKHEEVNVTDYSLWAEHPVENVGHRWGMSIDLSTCNGCGVCIVACQSENNVHVVGKDEVRRARDMHWLRMDRYFSSIEDDNRKHWAKNKREGDFNFDKMEIPEENPSVSFMPMLCHHCNHAPCETVCPVAATTHSNEGLNMMAYNRCIGTRYCGNNCPYKVRRFNWYNYRDYKKFKNVNPTQDKMERMVLNPDVVVRSRGVMEKCSFCIQRVQEGKLEAKKQLRPVIDGDVVTACSDVCPNDSITFGDWNDTSSTIREKSESTRAYQALEEIGIKPNLWYQLKVRNVDEQEVVHSENNEVHEDEH